MSDDPIEHVAAIAMTGAGAAGRVVEVLLRQAQEAKARRAAELRQEAQELQAQLEARGQAAKAWYREATEAGWLQSATAEDVGLLVQGVHEWAAVLPEAFGEDVERVRGQLRQLFDVDLPEAVQDAANAAALGEYARAGVVAAREDQGKLAGERDEAAAAAEAIELEPVNAAYDAPDARAERAAGFEAAGGTGNALRARLVADELNAHDPRRTAEATAGRAAGTGRPARRRGRTAGTQRGR